MSLRTLAILALSFLGMVDTLFLSFSRNAGPIPCTITHGCTDVLTSAYSDVAGVPLSWIGFAFYVFVFAIAVLGAFGELDTFRVLVWPATAALAASVFLTGVQALVLNAYCQYCLASAALSAAIFFLVWTAPARLRARGNRHDGSG